MKKLILSDRQIDLTDSEAEIVRLSILEKSPVFIPRLETTISAYDIKRLEAVEEFLGRDIYIRLGDGRYYEITESEVKEFDKNKECFLTLMPEYAEKIRKELLPVDEFLRKHKTKLLCDQNK